MGTFKTVVGELTSIAKVFIQTNSQFNLQNYLGSVQT